MERKFHGSESSLYGLFAPGNESAEERKGQLPATVVSAEGIYKHTYYTVTLKSKLRVTQGHAVLNAFAPALHCRQIIYSC